MSGADINTVSTVTIADPNAVIDEWIDNTSLDDGVTVSTFADKLSYVLSMLHDPWHPLQNG
ncbi:hypothetical protein EG830_08240 [bacterium]|nr:hypothetical protein [bacterium]